jgi:hypothetical protein
VNPVHQLTAGIKVSKAGRSAVGGTFLELGTGRRINMPIAYWIAGAQRVITIDINPYLKAELVKQDLDYIRMNREEIGHLFSSAIYENRLNALLEFAETKWNLDDLLKFCSIEYIAPADATQLTLPFGSIDFYISFGVFEHISPEIIKAILDEGNRLLRESGLFIHEIDHGDHFMYSDNSISSLNFLQFSHDEWNRLAGNRYMYMNRLRVDDFQKMFKEANQRILLTEAEKDSSAIELLRNGKISLDKAFQGKSADVLATILSFIVAEKSSYQGMAPNDF